MSDHAREKDLLPAAVSPQPQTRVQRDVVMTAIRGCCRTDRVGLTEREIDVLTQAIVDAYGPAAVSPQPQPPKVQHKGECIYWDDQSVGACDCGAGEGSYGIPLTQDEQSQRASVPATSQPAAVPVQDALTTLMATWKKKAINSNRGSSNTYAACAEQLEAALRREPPAVRTWMPTAENINALPLPLRSYIHQLETEADPAGTIRELVIARDVIQALEAQLRAVRTEKD